MASSISYSREIYDNPKLQNIDAQLEKLELRGGKAAKKAKVLEVMGRVKDLDYWKNLEGVKHHTDVKSCRREGWIVTGRITRDRYKEVAMDEKVDTLKISGFVREKATQKISVAGRVKNIEAWKKLEGVKFDSDCQKTGEKSWVVYARMKPERLEEVRKESFVITLNKKQVTFGDYSHDGLEVIAKVNDLALWDQLKEVQTMTEELNEEGTSWTITARIPMELYDVIINKNFVLDLQKSRELVRMDGDVTYSWMYPNW